MSKFGSLLLVGSFAPDAYARGGGAGGVLGLLGLALIVWLVF